MVSTCKGEKLKENICNKEIHAYQNEDGTYRVEINEGDTFVSIEKVDINITVYAIKMIKTNLVYYKKII